MSNVVNVKLLVDVAEGGRDLEKAMAAADAFGLGKKDPKYPRLKVLWKPNPEWFSPFELEGKMVVCDKPPKLSLPFKKDAVVTMTNDGAAKWIELGLCEITDAPRTEYS